jgi:hypothetical protein
MTNAHSAKAQVRKHVNEEASNEKRAVTQGADEVKKKEPLKGAKCKSNKL